MFVAEHRHSARGDGLQVVAFQSHFFQDVDEMFTELLKYGYPPLALHGGQDHLQRAKMVRRPRNVSKRAYA